MEHIYSSLQSKEPNTKPPETKEQEPEDDFSDFIMPSTMTH